MHKFNPNNDEKIRTNSLDIKMNMSMTPVRLLQKLYHDYNRIKFSATIDTQHKSLNKTNHSQKMTKFLNTYSSKPGQGISSLNSQSNIMNNLKSKIMTPNRYRIKQYQANKRCYFKSVYTSAHPFLATKHKIEEKNLQGPHHIKTEPVQTMTEEFIKNYKLMSPVQNRRVVQELKEKMMLTKSYKKERMEKVRYNYLVNNVFKGQRVTELNDNLLKKSKAKFLQANTQQRIFPNSTQIPIEAFHD